MNCFDRAINALEQNIVDVSSLISDKYNLDDYDEALKKVMDGSSSLKVMIKVSEI